MCFARCDVARPACTLVASPAAPDFCETDRRVWVVTFESSPLFCYSEETCSNREGHRDGRLTSSAPWPDSAVRGGLLSPFAEANPNLYKAHTVFAPYCTSDAWLGRGSEAPQAAPPTPQFNGLTAMNETLQAALHGGLPHGGNLAGADDLVLTGGAGAMLALSLLLPGIRAQLPNKTRIHLLCDGCGWGTEAPAEPTSTLRGQHTASSLSSLLEQAWPAWNPPAPLSPLSSVGAPFRQKLLQLADPSKGIAQSLILIAPQASAPLLSAEGVQLAGAAPAQNSTIQRLVQAARTSARSFAVEAVAAGVVPRVFSPNCAWPAELAASDAAFHITVPSQTIPSSGTAAAALVVNAINGNTNPQVVVDEVCATGNPAACNPSCPEGAELRTHTEASDCAQNRPASILSHSALNCASFA